MISMEQFEDEIWKPTYVNPDYLISNKGRIKNLDRPIWNSVNQSYSIRKGMLLKPSNKNTKKYWRIGIPSETGNKSSMRTYSIHRLVAVAFIPNPQNLPQINHIDGNKDNNCVENLEWCDNGFNQRHAAEHCLKDTSKISAHSNMRKLTEEQVIFIKQMYSTIDLTVKGNKMRFCKCMKDLFGLQSENTIHWIVTGGTNMYFHPNASISLEDNKLFEDYTRLWEASKPKKKLIDYAKELGVNYSSFQTRLNMFNRDLDATVNYYRNLRNT